jgi:hypothetical protein
MNLWVLLIKVLFSPKFNRFDSIQPLIDRIQTLKFRLKLFSIHFFSFQSSIHFTIQNIFNHGNTVQKIQNWFGCPWGNSIDGNRRMAVWFKWYARVILRQRGGIGKRHCGEWWWLSPSDEVL